MMRLMGNENAAHKARGRLIRCDDGKIRLRIGEVLFDIFHQDLEIEIVDPNASFFETDEINFVDYPSEWSKDNLRRYDKFIGTKSRGLVHVGVFSPNEVLPFKVEVSTKNLASGKPVFKTTNKTIKKQYLAADGSPYLVNMDSQRYFVFSQSLACVDCGLRGEAMLLDATAPGSAHFNLYGLDARKNLVMLTKDHLKPRSQGGKDVLSNYVTMCQHCNEKKGNKYVGLLSDHLRDWDFDL
jgi:hypothetical protein